MKKRYGIKAYGRTEWFGTEREFTDYLYEWMACTEGAERDRAVDALLNLRNGQPFTDTDAR